MKQKRLTILFVAVLAIVVTPRALTHFGNFVAHAGEEARAGLLSYLVHVGAPAVQEDAAPQAEDGRSATPCASQSTSYELAYNRASWDALEQNVPSAKSASREDANDAAEVADAAPVVNAQASSAGRAREEEISRQIVARLAPQLALANEVFIVSPEAAHLKSLLESGNIRDRDAVARAARRAFMTAPKFRTGRVTKRLWIAKIEADKDKVTEADSDSNDNSETVEPPEVEVPGARGFSR